MDILLVSVEYFDLYCNPQLSKKKKKHVRFIFGIFKKGLLEGETIEGLQK